MQFETVVERKKLCSRVVMPTIVQNGHDSQCLPTLPTNTFHKGWTRLCVLTHVSYRMAHNRCTPHHMSLSWAVHIRIMCTDWFRVGATTTQRIRQLSLSVWMTNLFDLCRKSLLTVIPFFFYCIIEKVLLI